MNFDDNSDFSGAGAVAKWLHDNGITSQEFQKEPQKWLELAIRAIKSTEKQAVNEAGTVGGSGTASIKGYFAGCDDEPKRRIARKKRRRNR